MDSEGWIKKNIIFDNVEVQLRLHLFFITDVADGADGADELTISSVLTRSSEKIITDDIDGITDDTD